MNQSSMPLFKRGDRVIRNGHEHHAGTITDGPFEPGLKRLHGETRRAFTYVVQMDEGCSQPSIVLSEASLKPAPALRWTYEHEHDEHPRHTHDTDSRKGSPHA